MGYDTRCGGFFRRQIPNLAGAPKMTENFNATLKQCKTVSAALFVFAFLFPGGIAWGQNPPGNPLNRLVRKLSFRRKPESRHSGFTPLFWIPAYAGMTILQVSEQV